VLEGEQYALADALGALAATLRFHRDLGSERLARYARLFGLGEPSGIELLGEGAGRVPSPKWLTATLDEYWGTGQTYIMGIGQGFVPFQRRQAVGRTFPVNGLEKLLPGGLRPGLSKRRCC
jgi:cell division protein FtsI/penicillin-binding protein 2